MNRKQYSDLIRKNTRSQKKSGRCCSICGTTENVQQHHITPCFDLSMIAKMHNLTEEEVNDLYVETTDMCDHHHKVYHNLTGENSYEHDKLSLEEFDKYMTILRQLDISQVDEKYRQDYEEFEKHMFYFLLPSMLHDCDFTMEELEEYEKFLDGLNKEIEEDMEME